MKPSLRDARGLVLFTDLDGTLLDAGYRPGPATAALARLRERGVLVVFSSAKTRAEQEPLRRTLGVAGPFMVENGSAVLLPPPCGDLPVVGGLGRQLLGVTASSVRDALERVHGSLGLSFRGFTGMTVAEVAAVTGLDPASAARARRREYSETLVGLAPGEVVRLRAALPREGLQLASGGRFHTVTGDGADKGAALRWLMERLRRQLSDPGLVSVAVGDSENDAAMLLAADLGFLVARPDGASLDLPGVGRLHGVGPRGFAELVDRLLAAGAGGDAI